MSGAENVLPFIGTLLQIMAWLIIARALLSWFPNARGNALVDVLYQITDPILIPLQRVVPRIGMIDISPMIAVFVLFILGSAMGGRATI